MYFLLIRLSDSNKMNPANTPYKVHQCSKYLGDTEYSCVCPCPCPCELCPKCKENNVKDLKTLDHDVASHHDKINYITTQVIYERDPSHVHTTHSIWDILKAYQENRQQHRGTIYSIRSDALFYRHVLLPQIKADFKACHTDFSICQSEVLKKAKKMNFLINFLLSDLINNAVYDFNFKRKCLKQKMSIHIVSLQEYELRYVQPEFTFSPLHFLSTIKTTLARRYLTLRHSKFSVTVSFNKEDVMESLFALQIPAVRRQMSAETDV